MRPRLSLFSASVLTVVLAYLFIQVVIPYASMWIADRPSPVTVPAALTVIYMLLVFIGLYIYITISEENVREFLQPILEFLRGGETGVRAGLRLGLLALVPLLVGWITYDRLAPKVQSLTGIRIQHPTIPGQYEKLINPYRNPTDDLVKQFQQQEGLDGIGLEEARKRLVGTALAEGRALYQKNCRVCHGSKADGSGPMAVGFRLRPANFRDPGTIATVVEAYAFWRISEGGRGLPNESSPWDSAMPRWKEELTEAEIWKIILAEYELADVEPRKPEKLE